MLPESRKYLYDIRHATDLLARFAEGKTFGDYTRDDMPRSAVERQLEIVGEALSQLSKVDPDTTSRIGEY